VIVHIDVLVAMWLYRLCVLCREWSPMKRSRSGRLQTVDE
jgi:hypothetical protein